MTYKPFFNVKLYRKIIQFPCFRAFPEIENNEMVKSENGLIVVNPVMRLMS